MPESLCEGPGAERGGADGEPLTPPGAPCGGGEEGEAVPPVPRAAPCGEGAQSAARARGPPGVCEQARAERDELCCGLAPAPGRLSGESRPLGTLRVGSCAARLGCENSRCLCSTYPTFAVS